MAYCRFSTDAFQCDLYVYESAMGIMVHVAKSRVLFEKSLPKRPPVDCTPESAGDYLKYHQAVINLVRESKRVSIELPYAGDCQFFDCPEDAAGFLNILRETGYRFPDSLPDALFDS